MYLATFQVDQWANICKSWARIERPECCENVQTCGLAQMTGQIS